jgi:cytochrome c
MKKQLWIVSLSAALSLLHAESGAELAQKNGCMACHQVTGQKSAPAFRGVANRNLRFNGSSAKTSIMESIKKGSKGKYPNFNGAQMPPYPNIPDTELNTLADWILSQGVRRGGGMGRGMGRGRGMGQPPGN